MQQPINNVAISLFSLRYMSSWRDVEIVLTPYQISQKEYSLQKLYYLGFLTHNNECFLHHRNIKTSNLFCIFNSLYETSFCRII